MMKYCSIWFFLFRIDYRKGKNLCGVTGIAESDSAVSLDSLSQTPCSVTELAESDSAVSLAPGSVQQFSNFSNLFSSFE